MNKIDRIQELSKTMKMDATNLGILVKAYGKNDQPDRATNIVKRLLRDPVSCKILDIRVVNAVVHAWAESSKPDAFDHAYSFFRKVTSDPKCVEMGLRPDAYTYSCLLKCLLQCSRDDAGNIVLELIDEMEAKYEQGFVPDHVCYKTAIAVCIMNDLAHLAEVLIDRMSKAGFPPQL
jgi:hypothetical protein